MKHFDDKGPRLVGIGLLALLSIPVNRLQREPFSAELLARVGLSVATVVVFWHVNRVLILRLRARFPERRQRWARWLLTFGLGIPASAVVLWGMTLLRYQVLEGSVEGFLNSDIHASVTVNGVRLDFMPFGLNLFQGAFDFTFFFAFYEILFITRESLLVRQRLAQAEKEKERLRAATLHSQLEALKQQVNPHFLFNSLNVLDSLIEEDPQRARVFLEELSTVYRYLLRANRATDRDQPLTPLRAELDFIESYYHLLKTRHGEGLHLDLRVENGCETRQLPPLTLQLLVENAVKHNVILPDQPLTIEIFTHGDRLTVRNNLQRKRSRVASHGVGLTNILTQYQMLGQEMPVVEDDGTSFSVTLGLISEEVPEEAKRTTGTGQTG